MALITSGQITITNLVDGKTTYTYYAWSNSSDGTVRFTTTYPDPTPGDVESYMKYRGVCSTFDETQPTDPKEYIWASDPSYLEASKVGNEDYEKDKEEILEQIDDKTDVQDFLTLQEMADKLQETYQEIVADTSQQEADLTNLEQRLIGLIQQLNDKVIQLEFIDLYFRVGEEGLMIGKNGSPFQVLLSHERMNFMDGGKVVAYFANQQFYNNNGVIVESSQVGNHKESKLDDRHTVTQYIGN